jgi:hypothetical protein
MRVHNVSLFLLMLAFCFFAVSQSAVADSHGRTPLPPPSGSSHGWSHSGGSHSGGFTNNHSYSHNRSYYNYHHGSNWGYHPYRYRGYYPFYSWGYYPFYSWGYYPFYSWGYYPFYSSNYYYYPRYYGYGYYAYGHVRIEVKPKQAKVYVDGGYMGTVDEFDGWWQRLDVPPGLHKIVIREPGYAPYAVTMRILPDDDYKIKYKMEPGKDVINEQEMFPERDKNYPDRYAPRYRDREPSQPGNEGQYEPGERDQYDRGEPETQGQPSTMEEPQETERATVVLKVEPSDATVYVDGNYYGIADADRSGELNILLSPGPHKVEVVRPGYESYSQTIDLSVDRTNQVTITLQKK